MNSTPSYAVRFRRRIYLLGDCAILLVASAFSYILQYFLKVSISTPKLAVLMLLAVLVGLCGQVLLVYDRVLLDRPRRIYLLTAASECLAVVLSLAVCRLMFSDYYLYFWLAFLPLALIGLLAFRYVQAHAILDMNKTEYLGKRSRTLIVGGGQAARILIMEMNASHSCPYYPVCIVDDNEAKLETLVENVPVLGCIEDIPFLCRSQDIQIILFAIPSCTPERKHEILDICSSTGCALRSIPSYNQVLFQSKGLIASAQPINIEELLGRPPITFNDTKLQEMIRGKVCMVTGGGGSIGSELCRQIARYDPQRLIIVDIYENNAYDIQQELRMEYGDALQLDTVIASVRDYHKMDHIFRTYQPNMVFHAAAHKHVPLMETTPEEAVKNNVFGTWNVANLAEFYKADAFVLISTDKAVNPTNVMGATKRCCEMVVQYMAQQATYTRFVAVRFGNVLGSNGSVIPLFKRQIESGRAVTVTHKDIIRYFMTIPEAVSLVLEASAMAKGGEIFVLDMGKPVRIVTLAENLIRQYGKEPYTDVPIQFTGLRPGEKLYEELLMAEEGLRSTESAKIFIGQQIEVDADSFVQQLRTLKDAALSDDSEQTVQMLEQMVPTFRHLTHEKKNA